MLHMHAKFIEVDWQTIAKAISLNINEALDLFSDGRLSGELLQRIAIRKFGLIPAKNCEVYDALFPTTREKIEIRLITKYGIKTAPSNQIGSSREFKREEYINKLEALDYFMFIDIREISGNIPCYLVPASVIRKMFVKNKLDKHGGTTSNKTIANVLFESVKVFWELGLGNRNGSKLGEGTW